MAKSGGVAGLRSYASRRGYTIRKVPANVYGGKYRYNIREKGDRRTSMWARSLSEARTMIWGAGNLPF